MRFTFKGKAGWLRVAAVSAGITGLLSGTVQAVPIPGVSTLQDLINLNQGDFTDGIVQGGIVIEGIRYYDFQYAATGANAPTAAQIDIQTAPAPVFANGLEFEFDWVSAGGDNMVSTIRYKIQSGVPLISANAFFNGDVPAGAAGIGTFAQVTETVRELNGNVLGLIGLFDDDTGPGTERHAASLALVPPQTNLELSKAIRVHSTQAGTATISIVDNTFTIPEPASLGLAVVGVGYGLLRRRRK